nr:reverse transcriptase domain-containing protein [Tanacetum cinerariifolium]
MLSPMFNHHEFFLLEELLPPKKRVRDQSFSSTSALPQEFEIGESSRQRRADKSFVSISLAFMLNIPPITLDTTYDIEMANGNLVVPRAEPVARAPYRLSPSEMQELSDQPQELADQVSSIPGGIDLRRVSSPANLSKRESILDEIGSKFIEFRAGGNFLEKMPRECLTIIESKSKVRYSRNKPVVAKVSMNTSTSGISPDVAEPKDMVKALLLDKKSQNQAPATVKVVEDSCVTCGGAHSYRNCPATDGNIYRDNIQEFVSQAFAVNYNQGNTSYRPPMMSNQIQPPGFPLVPNNQNVQLNQRNNKNRFNQNQNRGNNFNHGPVYQPLVFQNMQNQLTNLTDLLTKFVNSNNASTLSSGTLPSNTIANPRSYLKAITTRSGVSYDGPQISPLTSFLPKVVENEPEATKDTVHHTNNGSTEDVQPQNSIERTLLGGSPKEVSRKLGDPGKFLIPCDFLGKAECLALADLGASINLMPLSVWNKLSLPDLTSTYMTQELADRLISRPVGVAEDVYVKVGSFHFPSDFFVVDLDTDPRVPLILERSFLKTETDLIDVFEGFSNVIASRNPTASYDLIVSTISLTLTPFGSSDFLLEEVDAFLAIEDDPTSPKVDQSYLDPEGDILLLEAFLNDDPSLPPPNQENYLPEVRKELKTCEAKSDKSSIDEPLEVELKDLPPHLEYVFLEGDDKLPLIIVKYLSMEEKTSLITVLKSHKQAIAWKLSDIKGLIYPISDSNWVSPVHCVPKKGGFTVLENEDNELILTRLVTGWRVCIDYHKLNEATRKDHFPLPFMDQMMERLAGNQYYCSLNGFFGYFQIPIDSKDQEKTTFTCPYGTFAYRCMPFGLCNAPVTFQRCMMAIFHDMIEKTMEVFMDDFLVFRNFFQSCLSHLERMLKRCEDTNLCLNWKKRHFMVKDGIVLGHKISKQRIEVDKEKVDVITKFPHPTTLRADDPTSRKRYPFHFSKKYVEAFQTLKRKLTEAPILIAPDWDMPFELMYDASDFVIVYGPFRPQMKSQYIVYMDHSALKYLFAKKDSKARLLRWVLLLQEFTFKVIDTKGAKNLAADHLSRLENPHQNVFDPKEINESFPLETLNLVSTCGNSNTPWFADFV